VARLVGCSPLLGEEDITVIDVVRRWMLVFKLTEVELTLDVVSGVQNI
jgi:hypothetical protein